MRYFFILILIGLNIFSFFSFADTDGAAFDHNLGFITRLDISKNGATLFNPGGGIGANFEVMATSLTDEKRHIFFIDTNLRVNMGITNSNDVDFLLNLKGNLTGGIQAFSLVPLTLALEDAELTVSGSGVKGSSLVGTAFLLPIGQILKVNTDMRQLALTLTVGSRSNSMLTNDYGDGYPAMQVRIRYLDGNAFGPSNKIGFSAFSSLLFDISKSDSISEKKGSLGFAVNNLIDKGSHIGVEGSYTDFQAKDKKEEIGSVLFFVGSDFL